jgi:hypothetical protein
MIYCKVSDQISFDFCILITAEQAGYLLKSEVPAAQHQQSDKQQDADNLNDLYPRGTRLINFSFQVIFE